MHFNEVHLTETCKVEDDQQNTYLIQRQNFDGDWMDWQIHEWQGAEFAPLSKHSVPLLFDTFEDAQWFLEGYVYARNNHEG